ncbi:hypothetical protein BD309DRAFT_659494 [Dichomitus squalens]|nr:hypothetical protein BD309DRAFT_659494 [Dichomitus squalens]
MPTLQGGVTMTLRNPVFASLCLHLLATLGRGALSISSHGPRKVDRSWRGGVVVQPWSILQSVREQHNAQFRNISEHIEDQRRRSWLGFVVGSRIGHIYLLRGITRSEYEVGYVCLQIFERYVWPTLF